MLRSWKFFGKPSRISYLPMTTEDASSMTPKPRKYTTNVYTPSQSASKSSQTGKKKGLKSIRLPKRIQGRKSSYGSLDPMTEVASSKVHEEDNTPVRRNVRQSVSDGVRDFRPPYGRTSDGAFGVERNEYIAPESSSVESAVVQVERVLRFAVLLLAAYSLGVQYPGSSALFYKAGEYIVVAWITCVGIKVYALVQQRLSLPVESLSRSGNRDQGRNIGLSEVRSEPTVQTSRSLPSTTPNNLIFAPNGLESFEDANEAMETESVATTDEMEPLQPPSPPFSDKRSTPIPEAPTRSVVHAALDPFYIIDVMHNSRVFPNEIGVPHPLDNDLFSGEMLTMIRTPDVDDPTALKGEPANHPVSDYFRDKQRRFEFQFQFRLKKLPKGRVYFACELEEQVKIGLVQRAFVGAAMAFVKATNKTFHYSITGSKESPDGKYELPHMSFPLEEGMNRIVISREGETLPKLGSVLEESEDDYARRKKGGRIEPELGVTYTMSLWSAYCDYLQWKCLNLPGIRPFKLTGVVGTQPIRITLYDIDENAEKHYRKDVRPFLELELSNASNSGLGRSARKWINSQKLPVHQDMHQDTALHRPRSSVDDFDLLVSRDSTVEDTEEDGGEIDDGDASDEEAVAELGQGIYVRSGDNLTLRQSDADNPSSGSANESSCFVNTGGGFAVLQELNSATIVIEKVERKARSRRRAAKGPVLIRSGDTVRFKLVTFNKGDKSESKYLSIHRGWWLKWASSAPTKTSNFVIYTHETEFGAEEGDVRSSETQSSYLTIGGSFWLGHKRWAKFRVGVSGGESATFGGRMLGLYSAKDGGPPDESTLSDECDFLTELDHPIVKSGKGKGDWMRPLQLRAYESYSSTVAPGLSLRTDTDDASVDEVGVEDNLAFSCDDHRIDVPVWLEMMNRMDRVRQLVYIVRVLPPDDPVLTDDDEDDDEEDGGARVGAFCRLRTGSDLAQIMRVGLNWRNSKHRDDSDDLSPPSPARDSSASPTRTKIPTTPRSTSSLEAIDVPFQFSAEEDSENSEWELEEDGESIDELEREDGNEDTDDNERVGRTKKGRQLIGKIAKSVKRRGTSTGKTVVRGGLKVGKGTVSVGKSVGKKAIIAPSVKVGKGTVSAGKAIIAPIRSKNPPAYEPKTRKTGEKRERKRQERDLRSAVSRSMRRIEVAESKSTAIDSPTFLAGELSAAEQSCRTVSKMMSRMSDVSRQSPFFSSFTDLLAEQVSRPSRQDTSFLQGDAVHLGVVPKERRSQGPLLHGNIVARCLWESHWREEWCGIYEHCIELYQPLSTSPCLEVSYKDIRSIRTLDHLSRSPLPGFPMVVIETAWQCHYLAFADECALESFRVKAVDCHAQFSALEESTSTMVDEELAKARFWQGFQGTIESSLSAGKGKWAEIAVGKRHQRRTVLNRRRMEFDLSDIDTTTEDLVQELLSSSLSLSLDSLTEDPDAIVRFLDSTCCLRIINLNDMDLQTPGTFCTFVNLYHCLLQHALLLSVNGPLNKHSCEGIMRTSCYEIGGDIFSLAELQSIVQGKLAKSPSPKAPFVDAPKKSSSYHYFALGYSTPLVHFCLNRGHVSSPRRVAVLTPEKLRDTLHRLAADYIQRNLHVDTAKKTICVPKLCEVYKNDFADHGATSSILQFCLSYLDDTTIAKIRDLQREDGVNVSIKFQTMQDQYHTILMAEVEETGAVISSSRSFDP